MREERWNKEWNKENRMRIMKKRIMNEREENESG